MHHRHALRVAALTHVIAAITRVSSIIKPKKHDHPDRA